MAQRTSVDGSRPSARQTYPEDRFDRLKRTGRVGAHRVTARPRYIWQYLIAGLLGFAVLTTLGILAVQGIGGTGKLSLGPSGESSGSANAKITPELDPTATVAILNGTPTQYLAAALDTIVTEQQWGSIEFSGSAATADVAISAVFYSDPADAPAAAGLAEKLGGVSTYTSTDYEKYGVRLVVLLGADYKGPGIDEAAQLAANGGDATAEAEVEGDATGATQREVNPATGNEINPDTGLDIDPTTGWDIDVATGWPIDPATGLATDPSTIAVASDATASAMADAAAAQ
ncbi:LytR C-terminal domain-containing protein [Leucobacter japonicus]|uniref:LytR C-terminal domain-containing protein n=1 Tax=Leucobacter japonicus TaxID=1461259 RepID=UPI0006A7D6CF|nr:LytR C-terminal domain-containing protein [Leucobacter japonicus]